VPFPLSKVRHFSDFGGLFALSVQCQACKHERLIAAEALARLAGRDALVANAVRRLRCSKCDKRRVDVQVVGIPR
jgi:hypothetical protein